MFSFIVQSAAGRRVQGPDGLNSPCIVPHLPQRRKGTGVKSVFCPVERYCIFGPCILQ
ncbi:hypothetical protein SUBVAR_06204 [Subdoligranulum variabile DSM 15176]|uniref:Uncharacterized protein n=1 Tax=Subdoligranulum variabile DSM 15176 TaxID=411471 RepID=D1PP90_9FIRM|nr:hypothetical protein SUBVAR_06204 [Subdoligranulum variabile DSM 15176]